MVIVKLSKKLYPEKFVDLAIQDFKGFEISREGEKVQINSDEPNIKEEFCNYVLGLIGGENEN